MSASHPHHRCVFVGNIPYDATEEQLKEICEEVGPVVSFRLVIDRETGKPKGYGFCEYKDEETALSARRNLQGYEINGRQLRFDFAENDKNVDRSREQGRGGPGMVANVDGQRQFGGPAVLGDSSLHQPIGVSVAMAAAAIMAQSLGAAQTGGVSNQIGMHTRPTLGSDPLTLHLSKMSRNQLIEVTSEMKTMATQNKEQARQLLLACPHLPKAIFQAEIMLGIVPPQMLQMPNISQVSVPPLQPLVQDVTQSQPLSTQNLPGLPPLPQTKRQYNLLPLALQGAVSAGRPSPILNNQPAAVPQFPVQSQIQLLLQNQALYQNQLPTQSGNLALPLMRPQSLGNFSFRPQMQVAASTTLEQQVQTHPQLQHSGQVTTSSAPTQPSQPTRSPLLNQGFQLPPGVESALLEQVLKLTPDQVSSLPPDQQQQVIQLQQMFRQAS